MIDLVEDSRSRGEFVESPFRQHIVAFMLAYSHHTSHHLVTFIYKQR